VRSVDFTVTGRVQGVSFRMYAEDEAQRLGVAGWIRNEPDGSVAGHIEGDPAAVDAMVEWLGHGPRLARVERVDVRDSKEEGLAGFRVEF
jgi:acylphosphatase